jgi:hypothetical protein
MKNIKLVYLVAGMMALSAPQLVQADDAKLAPPPAGERNRFQNLSPEEREAKAKEFREKNPEAAAKMEKRREEAFKELGLKPEELKNLSDSERAAKMKQAADKKLVELQKKKTAGTITDAEKQTLQHLEQRKKFMEERVGGPRSGKPEAKKAD